MRRATSHKVQLGASTAQVFQFPPPVGGLNTRDSWAVVPLTDAIFMRDCYPTTTGIKKRLGYSVHTTGMPAQTETLMVYTPPSGTQTMFAAAGTAFYNVTTAGAVGAAVVSGLTNAKWESINFTNSSGTSYLCCFNGVDSPRYWDNATWSTITGVSTPAITGLTTSTIASAAVHQRRMWLVQVNSLKAWYLPIDSVGGGAQALDLGGIATRGGYIMSIGTWTVDGGDGLDDLLVIVTSQGQLVVYQGTDPSSASTWAIVGVFDISPPVNRRCLLKYKGDLLVITTAGVASIAKVMTGQTSLSAMITDKISRTYAFFLESAQVAGLTLWQLLYCPNQSLLLLDVCTPIGAAGGFAGGNVLPMNADTGAWGGGFTINARCMALFNNEPYYAPGTSGTTIHKFWAQDTDNGTHIVAWLSTAFSNFGLPGIVKHPSTCRIILDCEDGSSNPVIGLGLSGEFTGPANTPGGSTSLPSFTIQPVTGVTPWIPAFGLYDYGPAESWSVTMSISNADQLVISGAYVMYQPGGLGGARTISAWVS